MFWYEYSDLYQYQLEPSAMYRYRYESSQSIGTYFAHRFIHFHGLI